MVAWVTVCPREATGVDGGGWRVEWRDDESSTFASGPLAGSDQAILAARIAHLSCGETGQVNDPGRATERGDRLRVDWDVLWARLAVKQRSRATGFR